jgi:hypothetical protein
MEWLEQICTNPPRRISLFDILLPALLVTLSVHGGTRADTQTSTQLCGNVPNIERGERYNTSNKQKWKEELRREDI